MKLVFLNIFICLFVLTVSVNGTVPGAVITKEFKELSEVGFQSSDYDSVTKLNLAKQTFANASVYKQQGRHAEAIIEFQEALRWDTSAGIYFAMAESYSALDKKISVIEYCYKAIKLDSLYIPAYELLFNTYSTGRMYKEALTVADQILQLEPTRSNKVRYALFKGIENPRESISLLEPLLKDSTDTELMLLLSSAYEQNEQYEKMSVILERVLNDQPSNTDVASGLIEYYNNAGNFNSSFRILDRTEKYFDAKQIIALYNSFGYQLISNKTKADNEMIKNFTDRIDERFYFDWITQAIGGKLASVLNDTLKTETFYNRAFFLTDTSSFLYIDAAISYSNLKNYDKSIEILTKGNNRFPEDNRFDFYITNAYMLKKDYEKALEYGKNTYDTDSNNVILITVYASILQELKRYKESDRLYEKALQIEPLDASTNNNYAYSLSVRSENLNKALRFSQLSLESEPENSAYLDTYGWINYQLGNYETALEFILKAIKTGEISAEVYIHLGDIYVKLKKNDMALDSYRKALELDNSLSEVVEKINLLRN